MTTIIEENRKHLREAVTVLCGFRETTEEPTSSTPANDVQIYEGLANMSMGLIPATIMDLAGSGFLNDGKTVAMRTDSDSYRYGYISAETAKSDGSFDNPLSVTITAAKKWPVVTVELLGQYGETKRERIEPVWNGPQATIAIYNWTPGERVYMTAIYLGNAWIWNNEDLLGVTADLHSVNTELGGELEVSSIEIRAFEPTDYTDIICKIPKGAPIWYAAGYVGDMSDLRTFYLSEDVTWNDKTLTVRGQDATMLLENVEIPTDVTNWANDYSVGLSIVPRVKRALQSIDYDLIGSDPAIDLAGPEVVMYESKAARSVVSELTGIFRDENALRMTYVDAGIPTLWLGSNGHKWTIYADEISELNIIAEHNKNELQIVLPDYYLQLNANIQEITATANRVYFIDFDPPVNNIAITPTPTYISEITPNRYKFKAAATTDYTVSGYEVLGEYLTEDNPFTVKSIEKGEAYKFDFELPQFMTTGNQSLTKLAIADLLNRSNILYEFTYRGNTHIQPRDEIEVEVVTWEDVKVYSSGLYPANDLYPGSSLYPSGTYRIVRRMVREWVTMTVDTLTLEHSEGGGLSSRIRARRGAV